MIINSGSYCSLGEAVWPNQNFVVRPRNVTVVNSQPGTRFFPTPIYRISGFARIWIHELHCAFYPRCFVPRLLTEACSCRSWVNITVKTRQIIFWIRQSTSSIFLRRMRQTRLRDPGEKILQTRSMQHLNMVHPRISYSSLLLTMFPKSKFFGFLQLSPVLFFLVRTPSCGLTASENEKRYIQN